MNWNQIIGFLFGISVMLTNEALGGHLLENVARTGQAEQSSSVDNATAERAIDGNRDEHFERGSCTHTANESNPWWRVDLLKEHKITAIIITNRHIVGDRLDGAEIWIGKSPEHNSTQSLRCAVVSNIPDRDSAYFPCGGAEGRYVTVSLPGDYKILTLCEVEVYPVNYVYPTPNVALKGEAAQSSTLSFSAASKAIDGRRDSFFNQGFCSHTGEGETDPWWRVDLGRTHVVKFVKITNRGDCCAERLDGAEVRIGHTLENNGSSNPRCVSISHIPAGQTHTYNCEGGPMEGRYVSVVAPGSGRTLTLCEVEVYGSATVEPLPNIPNVALGKSSMFHVHRWRQHSRSATDGCRNTNWRNNCCARSSLYSYVWWTLDLISVYNVSAVTITNRQDCCPQKLLGATLQIEGRSCAMISSVEGTSTHTFQCDMQGRYVRMVRLKPHVTLCEVDVYGTPAVSEVAPSPTPSPSPSPPPPTTPPPPSVSMQLNGRNVTVVAEKLCWSDALFYCRRHYWDLLSLHSPQEQSQVEQLLRNTSYPFSGFLWLGLRRYVTTGDWFWMSGNSMPFSKWAPRLVPIHHVSSCAGMANGGPSLWHDQPCQDLHHFVCQSDGGEDVHRVFHYSTREPM